MIKLAFCSLLFEPNRTAETGPSDLRVKRPPVYQPPWRIHTVPLIAERQAGKL